MNNSIETENKYFDAREKQERSVKFHYRQRRCTHTARQHIRTRGKAGCRDRPALEEGRLLEAGGRWGTSVSRRGPDSGLLLRLFPRPSSWVEDLLLCPKNVYSIDRCARNEKQDGIRKLIRIRGGCRIAGVVFISMIFILGVHEFFKDFG